MTATLAVSPVACWFIRLYQRHLSPHKGFRCAYRARHPTRSSCSEFAKRAIERLGVLTGLQLLRRRFRRCHVASKVDRGHRRPGRTSRYLDRVGACANPSRPFELDAEGACCAADVGSDACCAVLT